MRYWGHGYFNILVIDINQLSTLTTFKHGPSTINIKSNLINILYFCKTIF